MAGAGTTGSRQVRERGVQAERVAVRHDVQGNDGQHHGAGELVAPGTIAPRGIGRGPETSSPGDRRPNGRLYALVTDWSDPRRVAPLFLARGFKVERRARIERPFQPAEYDRYLPGLFAYLDARARAGLARYRRDGAWCRLGVSFLEFSVRRSPGDVGTPPAAL